MSPVSCKACSLVIEHVWPQSTSCYIYIYILTSKFLTFAQFYTAFARRVSHGSFSQGLRIWDTSQSVRHCFFSFPSRATQNPNLHAFDLPQPLFDLCVLWFGLNKRTCCVHYILTLMQKCYQTWKGVVTSKRTWHHFGKRLKEFQ